VKFNQVNCIFISKKNNPKLNARTHATRNILEGIHSCQGSNFLSETILGVFTACEPKITFDSWIVSGVSTTVSVYCFTKKTTRYQLPPY